jgi:hypothetical protein
MLGREERLMRALVHGRASGRRGVYTPASELKVVRSDLEAVNHLQQALRVLVAQKSPMPPLP